jgi:hypothetical protein
MLYLWKLGRDVGSTPSQRFPMTYPGLNHMNQQIIHPSVLHEDSSPLQLLFNIYIHLLGITIIYRSIDNYNICGLLDAHAKKLSFFYRVCYTTHENVGYEFQDVEEGTKA